MANVTTSKVTAGPRGCCETHLPCADGLGGVQGVICLLQFLICGGLSNSGVLGDHLGGAGAATLQRFQGGSLPFHP